MGFEPDTCRQFSETYYAFRSLSIKSSFFFFFFTKYDGNFVPLSHSKHDGRSCLRVTLNKGKAQRQGSRLNSSAQAGVDGLSAFV